MMTGDNDSDTPFRVMHLALTLAVAAALLFAGCSGRTVRATPPEAGVADISQLWQAPSDLEARDLFSGPGGPSMAPHPEKPFTFLRSDRGGFSPGYDLRDPDGISWSVKLGPEAQTEVVSSRILWAIGYHQVPTYYLSTWKMSDGPTGTPGPARFRPELPSHEVVGEWAWHDNDFVHAEPFRGLIVANLILNNWDWKTSNNKVYHVTQPDGAKVRRYVVRDLGASLGETSAPALTRWLGARVAQGNRNDLEDFERQGFIKSANGTDVKFHYEGIYAEIVDLVRPDDVVWASRLLSRLSDQQWNDAFRAAGYPPDRAERYITKLKAKIAEGLALDS